MVSDDRLLHIVAKPRRLPFTNMTNEVEMKVKKPKSAKSEKAAAETPVKVKKTKSVDGSTKKKKRKADAEDEGAAAVVEVVRPQIFVSAWHACTPTSRRRCGYL